MTADPARPDARRRGTLATVLGAAALGVGSAWLWRRPPDDPVHQALNELWALTPPRPDGAGLALRSFRDRPLLINFWATWCPPCVRELPILDQFARRLPPRSGQVVGLALDDDAAVRQFLARTPVSFPVAILTLDKLELVRRLGNPEGGLPFSLWIDAQGHAFAHKLGALNEADLARGFTR